MNYNAYMDYAFNSKFSRILFLGIKSLYMKRCVYYKLYGKIFEKWIIL